MSYILLGLLSFVFMAVAEWATYKHIRFIKPFFWFAIIPLLLYSFILAWIDSARFPFPDILSAIAWFPFILFFALFVYSSYIEIPIRTYTATAQSSRIISDGTYSLCRHPAALWFTGWLVSAVFASKSLTLAEAAPLWILAYAGCIYLEEKWTCMGELGAEYRAWQKVAPMYIPDRAGMSSFWKYLKSGFRRKAKER